MKMTTSTRQAGAVMIVDISGRIELGEESAALRDLVCDLLSKGDKEILLNLGSVDHIPNKVADLMQLTKLYTVFDIMTSEAAGVKAFSQSTGAAKA